MSNTKISQLPSWSGTAADLRWFVMNNSGESETFKFSGWTSQIIPGNGNESYVTLNVPRTHAPDDYMVVLGNHAGTAASAGANSAVLGGRNNKTTNQFGVVAGGLNNTAGYICGVFGGNGGNADGNTAMIIGGENNTCSNVAWGGIFNGIQNYMGGGNDIGNGIIGGYLNRLSINGVYGCHIFGGRENRWHHFDGRAEDTRFSYGAMVGGYANRIEGNGTDTSGAHAFPIILGSKQSKIFGEESDDTGTTGATIINSFSSSIKDSYLSAIIEGESSQISGKTRAVMIGTSGRTANADNTTFVENAHTFRTYSTAVQAETTGTTFTCDLNNGGKAQFFITNAATINITNVRDGQSFSIKTQTNGNYSVTWTSTGYTFKFSDGGIQNPGNSTIDIFEFEVFGNVIYGNRKHNYT